MSSLNDIIIEVMYDRAEAEQNIANRLYKGEASKESYLTATVTAQVLRNVAGAVEQAYKIHRGSRGNVKNINFPISGDLPDALKRAVDALPNDLPEHLDLDEHPSSAPDLADDVDPDIFRKYLNRLLNALTSKRYPGELAPLIAECRQVIDNNPLSPARRIHSTYTRLLEECLNQLRKFSPGGTSYSTAEDIERHSDLIEKLKDILE